METIGRAGITRKKYGPWAETILTKNEFIKRLPKETGKQTAFEILKPLPTIEELSNLRNEHFTTTVGELVGEAFSTFSDLAGEFNDWYDNLPEGLQGGEKGEQVQEAASNFEGLSEVDVPEEAAGIKVVFIPEYTESRESRRDNAVAQLRAAAEALGEKAEDVEAADEDAVHGSDEASDFSDVADELNNAAE